MGRSQLPEETEGSRAPRQARRQQRRAVAAAAPSATAACARQSLLAVGHILEQQHRQGAAREVLKL